MTSLSKTSLSVVLLLSLVFIMSLRLLSDHDLGFILKGGEWITENVQFPTNDTYTYTVNQNEYINSHWLFQVISYNTWKLFGYKGLSILTALIVSSVFFIQWLIVKRKSHFHYVWLLFLIGVLASQNRFHLRPEIITWLSMSLFLLLILRYDEKKSNNIYWLLPVQLLWVNSHGLFILGWGIFGAYFLFSNFIKKERDKKLIYILLALPVVSLINPYGLDAVLFPFYLFTRLQEQNVMNNAISEFTSIFEIKKTDSNPYYPYLLLVSFYTLLVIGIISSLLSKHKSKLLQLFLLAVFAWLSMKSIRNIPLFVFVALPFTILNLSSLHYLKNINSQLSGKWLKPTNIIYGLVLLCFSFLSLESGFYKLKRSHLQTGIGLDQSLYPFECIEFMIENDINGRVLNDFNTGSWLEWHWKRPVFIDGRLEVMQEEFFSEYLESQKQNGLNKTIKKYKPTSILFDYSANTSWHKQLLKMNDWKIVMVDNASALFVKKEVYPELKEYNFNSLLLGKNLKPLSKEEREEILKTEIVSRGKKYARALSFSLEYPFSKYMNPAIFAYRNKQYFVAERLYLEFLKETGGANPEVFINLGSTYYHGQQHDWAKYCYLRAKEAFPDNPLIKSRIN